MDSQWLKTQFALNPNKNKTGLARALGLEPSAISKILTGTRQIKAQEYAAMRRYFGLPVDGEKAGHSGRGYVLEPLQFTGLQDRQNQESEWVLPAEVVGRGSEKPPGEVRVFRIQESAMEPDFRRGESVLVDLADTKPSPPGVFIVSDGFGYMIRCCEFVPGSAPPQVRISARSKAFDPQTLGHNDFKIVGRVIGKLQLF